MSSKCNIVSAISSRGFVLIRLSWAINFVCMTLTEIAVLIIELVAGQTKGIFFILDENRSSLSLRLQILTRSLTSSSNLRQPTGASYVICNKSTCLLSSSLSQIPCG